MLDYAVQAGDKSMYNTPPCFSIYMCGLVFAKMRAEGGLDAVLAANEKVCCVQSTFLLSACTSYLSYGVHAHSGQHCCLQSSWPFSCCGCASASGTAEPSPLTPLSPLLAFLQKAKVLYDAIAASNGFYNSPVDPGAPCSGCCLGYPCPCCTPDPCFMPLLPAPGLCKLCPPVPCYACLQLTQTVWCYAVPLLQPCAPL